MTTPRLSFVAVLVLAAAVAVLAHPAARAASTVIDIEFSGNVSLTNSSQSASFAFREVDFFAMSLLSIGGYFTESVQLTGMATNASGNVKADLVVGGFLNVPSLYPMSFAYYFDDETSWSGSAGANFAEVLKAHSSVSGGLGVIAYLTVQEVDPSGTVVATMDLSSIFATAQIGGTVLTDNTGNLKYSWVSATSGSATYNFTYIASQVLGHLNFGAPLTPKSTDVLLHISGYTYSNSANHLRLTYATGYGVYQWEGSATTTVSYIATGTAPNSVYVYNSNQASISGNLQSVQVQVTSHTQAELSNFNSNAAALINSYLSGMASGNTGYAVVTIDFTPGASDIVYDPATGFEAPGGSGNMLSASMLTIFVAIAMALINQWM